MPEWAATTFVGEVSDPGDEAISRSRGPEAVSGTARHPTPTSTTASQATRIDHSSYFIIPRESSPATSLHQFCYLSVTLANVMSSPVVISQI
jgi:hypothetical protein